MTTTTSPPCHTFVFKSVLGVDYHLDCYLPDQAALDKHERDSAPILIYWHGGGLCSGTRAWNDLVPAWLFGKFSQGRRTARSIPEYPDDMQYRLLKQALPS
jgi:hypothetical protein